MKSTTSCSDLPAASCARTWFLRSTASGAFDSASVWFWHTRQRSSCSSAAARFSTSPDWAKAMPAQRKRANLATRGKVLHQRQHLLLHHVGVERPDVLEADHAAAVDDVGLGHAVHAVIHADAPVAVEGDHLERVAVA